MPQQNATHVVVTVEYGLPSPAKGRVRENVTVEIPTPSAQYAEGAPAAEIAIDGTVSRPPSSTKGYSSTYLAMGLAHVRAGTWYPPEHERIP